ncbi:hypothetical protein M409DRAFT_16596 [Zasmidium cellare ATCC 36951]|uniref:FAD-binding domain-containing protein n=1 Tax=Zasmidium cellare ATCC 36951 TaxID=1080233 RepID=A0A6A6D0T9_ZASCE|nr:uncharacterized protein M409DRAFT_16596 [Zasmidium cellare ATCC 36951]KAF2172633.1 hypothetical protein M409DRAFT_16596 [Zasmidium cellare ATCC 36951]
MPLKVIVVGAGIAGLSAAIGLAKKGLKVEVYERRVIGARDEGRAGIALGPNCDRVLQEWGMLEGMPSISHDSEKVSLGTNSDGSIVLVDIKRRGHSWWGQRQAFKEYFRDHAIKAGAKVSDGARMVKVDLEKPSITLDDGREVQGDFIVAADGANSRIRQTLFPEFKPMIREQATFQVMLPLEQVEKDKVLRTLKLDKYVNIVVSPGRSIFMAPTPHQHVFDLQFTDHEFPFSEDPHPDKTNETLTDLTWMKQRWHDFGPAVRKALDSANSAFKWRFTEVMGVPRWSSPNGKVVLVGDSVHAQTPFAGQGSAMGMESGALLAELIAHSQPGDDLSPQLAIFEKIRRPRCELAQELSLISGDIWAIHDEKAIKTRNEMWRHANDPGYEEVKPDMKAKFGSPQFTKWMDKYDVFQVARDELNRARL